MTMERKGDREKFKLLVRNWARQLKVKVKSISIRPMSTKWASCSTSGNMNFNPELLGLPKKTVDYIIVHELLHFFVPNHGRLWKSLMHTYLGDYEAIEEKLKKTKREEHTPPTPSS